MANCKQCGVALPSSSFGDLSDYCSTCRPAQPAAAKRGLVDEFPKLSATALTWPVATTILIGISVSVFVAMVATGISVISPTSTQLLRWGADFGPFTLSGQYWRLISSSFLHIGVIHLAVNMVSLWILGRLVEKLFGAFITTGLYLLTAVGAGLLTLAWNPMRVSAGASGAIFGLDGVLISVLYFGKMGLEPDLVRRALRWVVQIAIINLLYGLTGNIDNMAHLGGLITGLGSGFFLARSFASPVEDRVSQHTRVLALTTLGLLVLVFPLKHARAYAVELQQGEIALQRQDYKNAISHFEKYIGLQPNNGAVHAALALAYQADRRVDDAVREYQRALALSPDMPWAQINLADLYAYQHKSADAVTLYKSCINKAKAHALHYRWYGTALYDLKNYAGAEAELQESLALDQKDPMAHELLAEVYDKLGKTQEARKERRVAADLKKTAS